MAWCGSEAQGLRSMLEESKMAQQTSSVTVKELEATESGLSHQMAVVAKQVAATEDEIVQAQNLHQQELDRLDEDLALNHQSISQVNQAVELVGGVQRQGGFLQAGVLRRLQLNEPGESSYVQGVMKQLGNQLETTRQQLQQTQQTKITTFEGLMQTKRAQLESLHGETTGKQQQLTKARVDLVEARRRLRKAEEKTPLLEASLASAQDHCNKKRDAWKVRSADRAREMAAIREAIGYLTRISKEL
eukprot:CAMPEP_0168461528 /NCGR_PEP_ID=MMETSP0228-20121227/54031_1 /TAXON_ID=133427 /ORGANISM="Protoceratium reticulatum, Strain CCCM 535 (=CCMP 1889)" /LENGTH=245 /DNA_ID=CAMNT_0008476845 /DNA_START=30 /DNA_END=764 /DNA_ORIENTATION=-